MGLTAEHNFLSSKRRNTRSVSTFLLNRSSDIIIPSRTVSVHASLLVFFFFQAEDGIRDYKVTGVQTCALPILDRGCVRERGAASATLTYTATIHGIGGGVPALASGIAAARLTFNRGGDRVTGSSFEENLGGVDGFTLSGQVFDTSVAGPLVPGALVQVCQLPAGLCSTQTANGNGAFSFTGLAGFTSYEVRADPPAGFTLLPHIRVVKLNGSTVKDLFLHAPVAPPAGTTMTSRGTNPA